MLSRSGGSIPSVFRLSKIRMGEVLRGNSLWLILFGTSYLIGFGFTQGAGLFGEASRSARGAPGLLAGINPFDGVFVPTFGSFYLVQTLLLPFVTVGIFASEKESGARKLNFLAPWSQFAGVLSHFFVFLTVWSVIFALPLSTLVVWKVSGGHLFLPETMNLILGHFLYCLVIFGISYFATAVTDSGASAAIVVLGFTLGSWILDFVAPAQTGWLLELSTLSLTSQIRSFESGLLDLGVLLRMILLSSALVYIGKCVSEPGLRGLRKFVRVFTVFLVCAGIFVLIPRQKFSFDLTEDQRHSFDRPSERALGSFPDILELRIGLSPDDSRFKDFNRSILSPLIRSVPRLKYEFDTHTKVMNSIKSDGNDSYGIITYSYRGRTDQSRSTSPEEVLPIIFGLASQKVESPPEAPYHGYPLEMDNSLAKLFYYALFPLGALIAFGFFRRNKLLEVIGYE